MFVIAVDIPLVVNAVDAGAVVLSPAVLVATVIVDPVKSCVPVHVLVAAFIFVIAVLIAPVVNAVVAGAVVLSPASFVVNDTVAPVKS